MAADTKVLRQVPLSRKAMLVSLSIKQFLNRVIDADATMEVAKQTGSLIDRGRFTKVLLDTKQLTNLRKIIGAARRHHWENTLPWSDGGLRALPAKHFVAYQTEQKRLAREFDAAADRLAGILPKLIDDARRDLGKLFNPDDYPTAGMFRSRFSMQVEFHPFPDVEDFRLNQATGVDPDQMERVRREIEQHIQANVTEAQRALWERIYEQVQTTRDRLAAYKVTRSGTVEHPFRDSLIENLKAQAAMLPKLNLDDDPELDQMHEALVKSLCALDPEALRNDTSLRQDAIDDADALLQKMAGYVGG